jgi:hypothetical protein
MPAFGLVIFVPKLIDNSRILPFICVVIPRKFLSNAVFARKNTLAKRP